MRELMNFVDIDSRAAGVIAVGMREMAMADGQEHPRELEMIALLESDLPESEDATVQLDILDTVELKDTFLRSLALVALVDGALKPSESELIYSYGQQLGRSEDDVRSVLHDVAEIMLSAFSGVTVFREQAERIGQSLGLPDEAIARILDAKEDN